MNHTETVLDRITIKPIRQKDWDDVLETEEECFVVPWTVGELQELQFGGIVAILDEEIAVAHMIYGLRPKEVHLSRIAVHPQMQGNGIGRLLMSRLIGRLKPDRRSIIRTWISDYNYEAQSFFRHIGFHAVRVVPRLGESGEDVYEMVYELPFG